MIGIVCNAGPRAKGLEEERDWGKILNPCPKFSSRACQMPLDEVLGADGLGLVTGADEGAEMMIGGDEVVGLGGDGAMGELIISGIGGDGVEAEVWGDAESAEKS